MWQLSLGNFQLCEAEKFFWSVAKTNYPSEMELNLNKEKITVWVTAHKTLVQIWFFLCIVLPSFSGRWVEECRVRESGVGKIALSAWCSMQGFWVGVWSRVPMGLQNLSLLAVSWGFVILPVGRGVGSRAGFRDRLFFLWEMGALLRFTVGPRWLSPHGVPSLSLLSWPMLWFFFSFHSLS